MPFKGRNEAHPSKPRIRSLSLSLRPYSRHRCLLTYSGPGHDPRKIRALLRAVRVIVEQRAARWDLTVLNGITVTSDLEATVAQIDQARNRRSASESTVSKNWLRTAAGCVVPIERERYRWHVVLDAAWIMTLTEPSPPDMAHNIVVHELAHILFLRHRSNREWLDLFDIPKRTWQHRAWLNLALPLWDEYAACRASAWAGDYAAAFCNFQRCVQRGIEDFSTPRQRARRKRWDLPKAAPAFIRAVTASSESLRLAAYLTGHLDGLGIAEGVTHFSTPARTSVLAGCFAPLREALRTIWDEGRHWHEGKAAMEPLISVLREAFGIWIEASTLREPAEPSSPWTSGAPDRASGRNKTQTSANKGGQTEHDVP